MLALAIAASNAMGCADAVTAPLSDAGADLMSEARPDAATTPPDLGMPPDLSLPPVPERLNIIAASKTGHDRLFGVAFNAQNEILGVGVVADSTDAMADFATLVVKLDRQGVVIPAFGREGFAVNNLAVGLAGEVARGIVVQSTGKIVVSAAVEHAGAKDPRDRDVALLRLNPDGSRDATFGTNGVVVLDLSEGEVVGNGYVADSTWALLVHLDDRLVVTGGLKRAGSTDTDYYTLRLLPDGARDAAFGTNGLFTLDVRMQNASARGATLLGDGSIVSSGYMSENGVTRPVVYKITPDGVLDTTFGTNGFFNQSVLAAQTEVYGAAAQGDKLVTIGYGRNDPMAESIDWVSLRLDKSGALDTSWGQKGVLRFDVAGFSDNARSVLALADGRVLFAGGGRPVSDNVDGMLGIATRDGAPDTQFGPKGYRLIDLGGPADFLWATAISPDRRTLAVVGTRGAGAAMAGDGGMMAGNDDSALYIMPAP